MSRDITDNKSRIPLRKRLSAINYNKLNYILIPKSEQERERFRKSRWAPLFRLLFNFFFMFSREGQFVLFVWMMVSALSVNVEFTQYYVVWSLLTGVLVASVGMRWFFPLRDVSLRLQGPPRVTQGEVVHLSLEVQNRGNQPCQALRFERPFLPWDGTYLNERPRLEQLRPGETSQDTIQARFMARGEHHLGSVAVRALTPLGLGLGPGVFSEDIRFLVIPKIAQVTHVEVDTVHKYQPGGVALASITGESRELIGVRPYQQGDPIRDLHARSWARLGFPVVREYQQEYFTRIGIIIDTDGGEADEPDFEAMLSLAAGIVAHLSRGEVLLDLLVLGDELHQLTLGRSLGFMEQALDLLACVQPKEGFSAGALQAQLTGHLSRLSCMLFLSLRWDDPRLQLADWVDAQGTRCRKIQVTSKDDAPPAGPVTVLHTEDIQQDREIVV